MSRTNHIVFLGDSMCMPRDFDGIPIETTYPYMLAQSFPKYQFFNRATRANTFVKQLSNLRMHDDMLCFRPEVVIINIGMADCAPRLFSEFQGRVLNFLPNSMSKRIIETCSKRRFYLTRRFPKVYVKPPDFRTASKKLIDAAISNNIKVILVGIAPVSEAMKEKSYGFDENIQNYNKILKENIEGKGMFIDVYEHMNPEEDLLEDGFHLTRKGNDLLYKLVKNSLEQLLK